MTDKPDAGEAARRMLAIASPKEKGVSYVYDGDRRRADMQLVASDWLAQAKRIEELEKALRDAQEIIYLYVDPFDVRDEHLSVVDYAALIARAALKGE